jgi:hypothetical protein
MRRKCDNRAEPYRNTRDGPGGSHHDLEGAGLQINEALRLVSVEICQQHLFDSFDSNFAQTAENCPGPGPNQQATGFVLHESDLACVVADRVFIRDIFAFMQEESGCIGVSI